MKQLTYALGCLLLVLFATWMLWDQSTTAPLVRLAPASSDAELPSATVAGAGQAELLAGAPIVLLERSDGASDTTRDWVVRGRVLKGAQQPYPQAVIEVHCVAGYDEKAEPAESTQLTCDAQGEFEWWLPRPQSGVVLRFAGAMPKHGGLGETVLVPLGEEPPIDIEFYVYPLDLAVTGVVTNLAGTPLAGAWVSTAAGRVLCEVDGSFKLDVSTAFGHANVSGGAPDRASERRLIQVSDSTTAIEFRLQKAFQIRGRVVDEQNRPIADAQVMTFFSLRTPTSSDADGRFVVDGLDLDRESHSLVARAEGYVEAAERVVASEPAREHELVLLRGSRVHGRVLGPDGTALAGAQLYLGFSPSAWNRLDAVSQDDGSFAFSAVGSGKQTLVTQRRGLAADQRVLQIDATSRDVEVLVQLHKGHFVTGVVVDEAGAMVAGVRISVRVASSRSRRGQYIDVRTRTAANGSFRLDGLPDGPITLELYGPEWVRKDVEVVAVDCSDLRIVVRRAGSIAGRVVDDATGQPVTSFRIRFVQHGGGIAATWVREGHSFSNPEGLWNSRGQQLEPGTKWGVEATADGYAAARVLDVVASSDPDPDACVLRLSKGGTVAGVVVDARTGVPIADAIVTWFVDEQELSNARHEPYGLLRAHTDATGRFELVNVPKGATQLVVETEGRARHQEGPFEVSSQQRVQLRIELRQGARIRGVVVDVDGNAGEGTLHLSPRDVPGVEQQRAKLSADGSFAFEGQLAGDYELFGHLRQGTASTPVARIMTVAAEQDLELRVEPAGSAVVTGIVTAEAALPDTCSVVLMPAGSDAGSRRAWRGVVVSGQFELRGIPAGEYRVLVTNGGNMGSATVSVPADGRVAVNLTLAARRR